MTRLKRLMIVLAIFLSGAILIPYFSLPDEAFSWQTFANGYGYPYTGNTGGLP
ncbi:MAG TPA: hypothetical protein VEC93_20825 [Anaerolineae bacterium]|nr:hypothetical protein [Anaerolineae bacterium]